MTYEFYFIISFFVNILFLLLLLSLPLPWPLPPLLKFLCRRPRPPSRAPLFHPGCVERMVALRRLGYLGASAMEVRGGAPRWNGRLWFG